MRLRSFDLPGRFGDPSLHDHSGAAFRPFLLPIGGELPPGTARARSLRASPCHNAVDRRHATAPGCPLPASFPHSKDAVLLRFGQARSVSANVETILLPSPPGLRVGTPSP